MDDSKHILVDLQPITRATYMAKKKEAVATAHNCFLYHIANLYYLFFKDGTDYYYGWLMQSKVDPKTFTGVTVVEEQMIRRIYIDKLNEAA